MKSITTIDYYRYKTDATNVDLDIEDALTKQKFYVKRKAKFDTSKAGIRYCFLISGQDWNAIKVTDCVFISREDDVFLYDVVMEDKFFDVTYKVKIKVMKSNLY